MIDDRYCVSLSNNEFVLLLSAFQIKGLIGFELNVDKIDKQVAVTTMFDLVKRELADSQLDRFKLNPDLTATMNNIANAEYVVVAECKNNDELNTCLYCTEKSCTAVVNTDNDRFLLSALPFSQWLDEFCADVIPNRFRTTLSETLNFDDESFIDVLLNIRIYRADTMELVQDIRLDDNVSFGTIAIDDEKLLFSDKALKNIIINIIGEKYGIS